MNGMARKLQALVLMAGVAGGAVPAVAGEAPLREKTLVAWVSPANLTQRGSSSFFARTQRDPRGWLSSSSSAEPRSRTVNQFWTEGRDS